MENEIALPYVRVSSLRQKTEGHGLDSQLQRCEERARGEMLPIEKVFRDSYTGGGDFMKRPAMRELLAHIDANPTKRYVVIFDDLKRFARDVEFHLKLRTAFRARKVRLICLNFNFEESPTGRYVETIMAAGAELEREQNKVQVRQKMQARLERGYWPFYQPPGYKIILHPVHGKFLVPNEKAPIIQEALEGFASGRFHEIVDVQRFLQEAKYRDSGSVHLGKVKELLCRTIYTGYIEYPRWGVSRRKGHHEALVSLATYEKIQERLKSGAKTLNRKDINEEFPLRGFVLCAKCRRACTASRVKGRGNNYWSYYRCNKKGCPEYNKAILKKEIENRLMTIISNKSPREGILRLTEAIVLDVWKKRGQSRAAQRAAKQRELISVREESASLIGRVGKAKEEGVIEAYERKIGELTKREQFLTEELEEISNQVPNFETALTGVLGFIKNPVNTWENGDIQDRRLVLRLFFREKLAYNRETGFETAKFSIPARVSECSMVSKYRGVELGILKSRPKIFGIAVYKLRIE